MRLQDVRSYRPRLLNPVPMRVLLARVLCAKSRHDSIPRDGHGAVCLKGISHKARIAEQTSLELDQHLLLYRNGLSPAV